MNEKNIQISQQIIGLLSDVDIADSVEILTILQATSIAVILEHLHPNNRKAGIREMVIPLMQDLEEIALKMMKLQDKTRKLH